MTRIRAVIEPITTGTCLTGIRVMSLGHLPPHTGADLDICWWNLQSPPKGWPMLSLTALNALPPRCASASGVPTPNAPGFQAATNGAAS